MGVGGIGGLSRPILDFLGFSARKRSVAVLPPRTIKSAAAPAAAAAPASGSDEKVLAIARKHNGGGYNEGWTGSGYPEPVVFVDENKKKAKGSAFNQAAVGGTYCCGFTFGVVMAAAQERGLLKGKSAADIQKFQQEWNGAAANGDKSKAIFYQQCGQAVQNLGIGKMVEKDPASRPPNLPAAQPGDFMQFWRGSGNSASGHSVVFLGYETRKGPDGKEQVVGVKYRSSQPSTNGIGDRVEYFAGAKDENGKPLGKAPGQKQLLNANAIFAGRLNQAP